MQALRTVFLVSVLAACGANDSSRDPAPPAASQKLTARESELLSKDKPAVEALLGAPVKKRFWTNVPTPPALTPEQRAAFEGEQLDEIWIYRAGRIHFSLAGKVVKVDDNSSKELPPE